MDTADPTSDETHRYRTINEAAKILRISRRSMQDIIHEFPDCAFRIGRKWLFADADIERLEHRLRERHLRNHRAVLKHFNVQTRDTDALWRKARQLLQTPPTKKR